MAQPDFYDVLGVGRDADEAQIKSAFRKKAMQYHPDRNPGDGEAERNFKQVNEAYEILKDGEKRAAYDRFGHAAFQQGGGPGAGGFGRADSGRAAPAVSSSISAAAASAISSRIYSATSPA